MPMPQLTVATRAAIEAGRSLMQSYGRIYEGDIKEKTPNDFVTKADTVAEAIVIEAISTAYRDHAILCEERGLIGDEDNPYCWIIDPLDGTTNFMHNFPHFAVSIALLHDGKIIVAVVYDPVKNELFSASLGEGAMVNNRRIRVSKRATLSGALLATGMPYQKREHLTEQFEMIDKLIIGTAGIRRAGAAALDLAYVAAGRFDGFWEYGLHPWDIAAGALLVTEAGGFVADINGEQTHMQTGNILAANPGVFKKVIAQLSAD